MTDWKFWLGFNLFVLAMLALDLGVFHRKTHDVKWKEALAWSGVWIALALIFNVMLYFWKGGEAAMQFFTGYLIEKSLSVDNIFVFLLIFAYFRVPPRLQHKVLFWGILGALAMRAIFIFAGIALLERFDWMIYVFGALLIVTGIKMALQKDKELQPERNPLLKLFRRFVPTTKKFRGDRFFVKVRKRTMATPLMVALLFVEISDLIFAVDSIPAILAITTDPFLVYTSNVFAILGLRSLYFALSGIMDMFHYLHYGLAAILTFVGSKMVIVDYYHVPIGISLGVIATILIVSVVASLAFPHKNAHPLPSKA
jgi:tellurite resistance protein TerC